MAKATQMKLYRMFDVIERKVGKNKDGTPMMVKDVIKRAQILPAKARFAKKCARVGCDRPMFVSDGQVAYMHKECRKAVRHGIWN